MTKFTDLQIGKVGAPDGSDTDFASIDSSGRALFLNRVIVGATAAVIEASGTATFEGPIKGPSGVGTVVLTQQTTILSNNSAQNPATFALPSGSNLINFYVDVETPFAAGALVTAARVNVRTGVTANVLAEFAVSASGRYDLDKGQGTGAASLFRNVTATINTFVSTKALASALTAGQAMLSVTYVQNS